MKKLLSVLILGSLLAGCAQHYYRNDDGLTKLFLEAPDATSVSFASSLDGYALHPAQRLSRSTWAVSVPSDIQFSYFYVIDGSVYLPDCPYREHDDFGSENCVFIPGM